MEKTYAVAPICSEVLTRLKSRSPARTTWEAGSSQSGARITHDAPGIYRAIPAINRKALAVYRTMPCIKRVGSSQI